MKERGILFSGPMVKAILKGRKTQTRRVIKLNGWRAGDPFYETGDNMLVSVERMCPYGQLGDLLYVRETWKPTMNQFGKDATYVRYKVDDSRHEVTHAMGGSAQDPWRPSIHMPKWASRIWLTVTDVRVEQVQEISEGDVIAEGLVGCMDLSPAESFSDLWDSINAKRGHGWDINPYVWVIAFKRRRSHE